MSSKIEGIWIGILIVLSLVLLKDMAPAILQDERAIIRKMTGAEEEIAEEKRETFSEALPVYFDGRDQGICPVVKDQGEKGNCWALAATSTLEAGLLPQEAAVFSADHISEENYFTIKEDAGDYTMLMAYLAGWQGPVLEETSDSEEAAAKHVQEIQVIEHASVEEMKAAIYQYGAVQASIYMDLKNAFSLSPYYNQFDHSYYYRGEEEANHDICILGWDDRFPASSFYVNTSQSGAFICQNSWGDKFGDQGIFYVSYEDSRIRDRVVFYPKIEETDNYDHLYQTDLCGWVGAVGYGDRLAYAANRFQVGAGERIEAVGFYTTGTDTGYEIYLLQEGQRLEHVLMKKPVAKGCLANMGFYTIPLEETWFCEKAEEVTVILKLDTPGSEYPLATEYVTEERTLNVTLADGDGYISHNGFLWQDVEESFGCNVCMKLYTKEE